MSRVAIPWSSFSGNFKSYLYEYLATCLSEVRIGANTSSDFMAQAQAQMLSKCTAVRIPLTEKAEFVFYRCNLLKIRDKGESGAVPYGAISIELGGK